MLLSEQTPTENGLWVLLLVLALVTLAMVMVRLRHSASRGSDRTPREQIAGFGARRELGGSLDELMVQLEEFSRRINAQVDTKLVKLETVIRDADERIARLQRVLAQVDGLRTRLSSIDTSNPARTRTPTVGASDTGHQSVYDLRDRGKTPVEIAEELQLTLGEVELILNLRDFG